MPVIPPRDSAALVASLRGAFGNGPDMNPAHIIRECLTNRDWGLGYASVEIGSSFTPAADTLYAEGFGLSLIWQQDSSIEDFIGSVLDHIDATLFIDRRTGHWVTDEDRGVRYSGTEWIALPRPGIVPIRILGGAAHTLQLIDTGCILETTGASPATLTIPDGATVPFAIGALINITQVGAGVTTLAAAPDVSLNGVIGGAVALAAQWGGVALTKRGADAWVIQGALAGAVT